jgi:hypothetical protein
MPATVNLLTDKNGLYSGYRSASGGTVLSEGANWSVTGAVLEYIPTEFVSKNRVVLRLAPSSAGPVVLTLSDDPLPARLSGKKLSFNAKVKPLAECFASVEIGLDGQLTSEPASTRLPGGLYSAVNSNAVQVPEDDEDHDAVVQITFTGHRGSNIFVTYPNLIDDEAFYNNIYVPLIRQYMPDFYWEIDSAQTRPSYPLHRLIDVLTTIANEVYREYTAMYPYERRQIGSPDLLAEIVSKSVLVDPFAVREKYIPWLSQFTGYKAQRNIPRRGGYKTTVTRTNLSTNPSFETNTTGWETNNNVHTTFSRVTTDAYIGTGSAEVAHLTTNSGFGARVDNISTHRIPVVEGDVIAASVYVKNTVGTRNLRVSVRFYDNATDITNLQNTNGTAATNPTTWTRVGVLSAPAPSGALFADILVNTSNTGSIGDTWLFDAVLIEKNQPVEQAYFDGGTADPWTGYTNLATTWTGTTNNSTSIGEWGVGNIYIEGEPFLESFALERSFIDWQLLNSYYGRAGGTRQAMLSAVEQVLFSTKDGTESTFSVALTPNYQNNEWQILLRTIENETPDASIGEESSLVLAAVSPAKPLGYKILHETVDVISFILNDVSFGLLDVTNLGSASVPTGAPENITSATESGPILDVIGSGTSVTFYAQNSFLPGSAVTTTGVNPSVYNYSNTIITSATSETFTVSKTDSDLYVSGGSASCAESTSTNSVRLWFTPLYVNSYDGGGVISNYKYFLSTNGGSTYDSGTLLSPAKGDPPITITGLSSATAYSVTLLAINEVGESSVLSSPYSFTTK